MEWSTYIAGLLIMYICWDVHYYIRFVFTVVLGRLIQKRIQIRDTATILSFCTTQDTDTFLNHMNNARFLRELDFARYHYYAITGLYEEIVRRGGGFVVQSASNVRYRRFMPIFSRYRVETQLAWWDEKNMYLEHKFVTSSDDFVRTVIMSKLAITKVNVVEILAKYPGGEKPPTIPEELRLWLDSNEVSSRKLRSG